MQCEAEKISIRQRWAVSLMIKSTIWRGRRKRLRQLKLHTSTPWGSFPFIGIRFQISVLRNKICFSFLRMILLRDKICFSLSRIILLRNKG